MQITPYYLATVQEASNATAACICATVDYAVEHKPWSFVPGAKRRRRKLAAIMHADLSEGMNCAMQALRGLQQRFIAQHPDWNVDTISDQIAVEWDRQVNSNPRMTQTRHKFFEAYARGFCENKVIYENETSWRIHVDVGLR